MEKKPLRGLEGDSGIGASGAIDANVPALGIDCASIAEPFLVEAGGEHSILVVPMLPEVVLMDVSSRVSVIPLEAPSTSKSLAGRDGLGDFELAPVNSAHPHSAMVPTIPFSLLALSTRSKPFQSRNSRHDVRRGTIPSLTRLE
jgi:hypothetical protein